MPVRGGRDAFLIRIWREETDPDHPLGWRGWVQHVHSGETRYVQEWETLRRFIEQRTGRLCGPESAGE
ncbi:MAG: hypothetical protein R3248_00960 [Candidatus Promineifilaceae bacterium]|nr:hypothetical protein [Candidatus Promineifilaceae bacterium]